MNNFMLTMYSLGNYVSSRQSQTETSRTGWVEINGPPLFDGELSAYFLPLPVNDGLNGKFLHVARINIAVSNLSPLSFLYVVCDHGCTLENR